MVVGSLLEGLKPVFASFELSRKFMASYWRYFQSYGVSQKYFDNACILLSYCLKHCSTCKCDPDSQDDHRERERGRENRSMTTTAGVRLAAETLYKEDDIAICVLVWFDPLVLRFVCWTVRRFLSISCRSL